MATENNTNFASWEKHTKGIGSKLLNKFGFNGRLGLREDGIAKAIEVTLRPAGQGLGFGEEEHRPTTTSSSDSPRKRNLQPSESSKGKKRRRKFVNDSDSDGSSEEEDDGDEFGDFFTTSQDKVSNILDMRQNNPKVLTDFTELSQATLEEYKNNQATEEIIYFRKYQRKVNNSKQKDLENANQMCAKYEMEIRVAEDLKAREQQRVALLSGFMTALEELHQLMENTVLDNLMDGILLLKTIIMRLCDLMTRFPEEYEVFGLNKILKGHLSHCLALAWSEDHHGEWTHFQTLIQEYKKFVQYLKSVDKERVARDAEEVLAVVMTQDALPPLRRYLSSPSWDPTTHIEMVDYVELLRPFLSPAVVEDLCEVVLLPRLTREVHAWPAHTPAHTPQAAVVPLHVWVVPWISFLGPKASSLFPEIRRKLAVCMKRWQPHDTEVIGWLGYWAKIFDVKTYEHFIGQTVLPRLVDYWRRELVIDPRAQDIRPVMTVLQWQPVLPVWQLAFLFAGEFFPKWYRTLFTWLSMPAVDYQELVAWYSGWKSLFPPALLTDESPILLHNLSLALDMMQDFASSAPSAAAAASSHSSDSPLLAKYTTWCQQVEQVDYYALVQHHTLTQRLQDKQHSAAFPHHSLAHQSSSHSSSMSLREIVEVLAEKHNLTFQPKLNRFVDGKQVWALGEVLCYLENQVVFVWQRETNTWPPMALEDVLVLAARPVSS